MNNKEKIEKKNKKDINNNKEKNYKEQQNYNKNKELIYETIQLVSKKIQKQPIISVLISMSIGYILGILISKKKK